MSENDQPVRGRKVIFLHPHSVVADALITAIAEREYEVHRVHDHQKLRRVLHHPDLCRSLLFINMDEELPEPEWEAYIRSIRESNETKDVQIGILSYNEDPALASKYLMDIGVQAGYIKLKLGVAESTRIILATLVANEAKGLRQHVRATCEGIPNVSMNIQHGGSLWRGELRDISIVGMACIFERDPALKTQSTLPGIQLNLRGSLVVANGMVAGARPVGNRKIYVVLFDQPHPEHVRERLLRFIRDAIQLQLERLLQGGGRKVAR
jgi:hypothetical protein